MKRKKKHGFTLIELLSVIVILGVVLLIALMVVKDKVKAVEDKAFFLSVNTFISETQIGNELNSLEYCYFNSEKEDVKLPKEVEEMQIIAYKENDKVIYSVYARNKSNTEINTNVFSKLFKEDSKKWADNGKNSFTFVANLQLANATNFKRCKVK